ncbi:MAG TPA: hypothetical protein VNW29_05505 [Candidatus Sulfotelmatobacter sp.]|nr:hypothetical protein [Candidatus Sulfotelmatobacter sp.]
MISSTQYALDTDSPTSADGGVRYSLLATADGKSVRRISPGEGIGDRLRVGSEVSYKTPDSNITFTSYTDPRLTTPDQRDNHDSGVADYLTLIGATTILLNGDTVVARTIRFNKRPSTSEEYIIISKGDHHTVFKNPIGSCYLEEQRIRHAANITQKPVAPFSQADNPLSPTETTKAFRRIGDAYIDALHQDYIQASVQRKQKLLK